MCVDMLGMAILMLYGKLLMSYAQTCTRVSPCISEQTHTHTHTRAQLFTHSYSDPPPQTSRLYIHQTSHLSINGRDSARRIRMDRHIWECNPATGGRGGPHLGLASRAVTYSPPLPPPPPPPPPSKYDGPYVPLILPQREMTKDVEYEPDIHGHAFADVQSQGLGHGLSCRLDQSNQYVTERCNRSEILRARLLITYLQP